MNPSMFSLEDKVALITGGSRGIGRASALALADAGATVVVSDHTRETAARELVPAVIEVLAAAEATLSGLEDWHAGPIETALRGEAEGLGLKAGPTFQPVRVATSGKRVSPPLFESLEILGRETSLARLSAARRILEDE